MIILKIQRRERHYQVYLCAFSIFLVVFICEARDFVGSSSTFVYSRNTLNGLYLS